MLGQAVAQVFYAEAARNSGGQESTGLAFRVLSRLLVLGTSPLLLLATTAPYVFRIVLGAEWNEAGRYAQVLVPFVLSVFVSSHLFNLVFLLGRERADMVFQLLLLLCRLGVLAWGISRLNDPVLVIAVHSLLNAVLLLAYGFWLLSLTGTPIRRAAFALAKELGLSALLVAPAAFASDPLLIHPIVAIGLSLLLVGARVGSGARDLLRNMPRVGRR